MDKLAELSDEDVKSGLMDLDDMTKSEMSLDQLPELPMSSSSKSECLVEKIKKRRGIGDAFLFFIFSTGHSLFDELSQPTQKSSGLGIGKSASWSSDISDFVRSSRSIRPLLTSSSLNSARLPMPAS